MLKALSDLKAGEHGVITELKESPYKARLLDMGCIPGEEVELSKTAPLGCPFAIYVAGYELSLRKNEAENVLVEVLN
ncbi:MAG: ferrous iron transport protein A [Bacteroidia bacterium]|nr:ferrous iron transport protein A [Bacteroidia bacterium]